MAIYPGAGALLIDCNAEPWERDAQGCHETNLQINPYYSFATREEYYYNQSGIKKKGMKTNYDNMLKEENTTLHFPSFTNRDGVQKLIASMPDDQALGEWERYTLEVMRWIDSPRCPIKYWSGDIIKSMRWLMRQPAYTGHLISATQRCFNSDMPPKCLFTKLHTSGHWFGETKVRRDTRG
jgi:hypothetical protein